MLVELEQQHQAALNKFHENQLAEEERLQNELTALEEKHQAEIEQLRIDEEAARQQHADDELARQESLWNQVKLVFGTAIESMLAAWTQDFIGKMITAITDELIPAIFGIGKAAEEAAEKAGGIAEKLGGGAADSVASGVKIVGKSLTAVVDTISGIVTAIASVAALFKKSGPSSTDSWHFEHIWKNVKETRDWHFINHQARLDEIAKAVSGTFPEKMRATRVIIRQSRELLKNIWSTLKAIRKNTASLKGATFAQHGFDSMVYKPTMFMAGEKGVEHVRVTPSGGISGGGGGGITLVYSPTIQAMDSQDVYKFMSTKGKDALVQMIRGNVGGLTQKIKAETEKY